MPEERDSERLLVLIRAHKAWWDMPLIPGRQRQAEVGGCYTSSKPAWSTEGVPSQSGLHNEIPTNTQKMGCQHILYQNNVYWDTDFPVRGNQWLLCKKPSHCLLLLFCFYLKQKKKSSDQSYLVGKICKERITSLAISYLYQFLELLNKTTWKTRANHHKMFYLPFTVIGSVQKFSLIFSKLVNWQKLDNHFQIYWYERDSILWLQKHWGSNKGIKRQN